MHDTMHIRDYMIYMHTHCSYYLCIIFQFFGLLTLHYLCVHVYESTTFVDCLSMIQIM